MKAFFQDKKESRFSRFQTLDYAPHLQNALELGFLEQGESILSVEGEAYPLKAGDLFVIFPHLIHSFEQSCEAQGYLSIMALEDLSPFHTHLLEEFPESPVLSGGAWDKSLKTLFSLACSEGRCLEKEVKKGYCRVIAGTVLSHLTLKKRERAGKSTLREILEFLSAHSGEAITRQDLARSLGISESAVSHFFSENLKTSFPAYRNKLRLQEATELLGETKMSITQIAVQTGFGSLRSFNRAFRKEFGVSPGEYRKQK